MAKPKADEKKVETPVVTEEVKAKIIEEAVPDMKEEIRSESVEDIKEIGDVEDKLSELYKQFISQKIEVDQKELPLIIHNEKLYGPKSSEQIKGNKKAKAYYEEIVNLGKIAKRIKELHDSFKEEAKEMEAIVNELRPVEWGEMLEKVVFNLQNISKIS